MFECLIRSLMPAFRLFNSALTLCFRYAFAMKYFVAAVRDAGAGGGAVVNVASTSSFVAQPAFVPYSTSKGRYYTL